MRQVSKRKITKIDPRKELSPYLNHQENKQKVHHKKSKLSASLSKLKSERKRSLVKKMGILVGFSSLMVIGLAYYVSPIANVKSVEVKGARDISAQDLVKVAGISVKDKIIDSRFGNKYSEKNLVKKYPEIKGASFKLSGINGLVLQIQEYPTIAYIKENNGYRKVLSNDRLGSTLLSWSNIDQDKPLFIGYSQKTSLATDLNLFDKLPDSFRREVKLLSGKVRRKTQIIFVMKDGNVVIGDISTIKQKIKYYDAIRSKAGKNSLIDLEVGAFSRPLTKNEMKAYSIT